jgi:hypothetical protein
VRCCGWRRTMCLLQQRVRVVCRCGGCPDSGCVAACCAVLCCAVLCCAVLCCALLRMQRRQANGPDAPPGNGSSWNGRGRPQGWGGEPLTNSEGIMVRRRLRQCSRAACTEHALAGHHRATHTPMPPHPRGACRACRDRRACHRLASPGRWAPGAGAPAAGMAACRRAATQGATGSATCPCHPPQRARRLAHHRRAPRCAVPVHT